MKAKRFENIWTMGLILCVGLLLVFYLIKLIFPQWIVGVAETPNNVALGNFIDSNKWSYYLYTLVTSMVIYYLYCCACCRKKKLTKIQLLIVVCANIFLFVAQIVFPEKYMASNLISLLILPCVFCKMENKEGIKYLYSTTVSFSVHNMAQVLSLSIRDISTRITCDNSATYFVCLLDMYIWLFLLYNYFNAKEEKKNGQKWRTFLW